MDWQAIESAPKDGTKIIGLGYSQPEAKRNGDAADVRIIRAWSVAGKFGGWSAINNHSWFTVAFYPTHWTPYHAPGD